MRVLCLTPWFPNAPGEREGNYIHDSIMALREQGIPVNVLLTRVWKPWQRNFPQYRLFPGDLELRLIHYPGIPRDYLRVLSNRLQFFVLYRRIVEYGREHRVQLIHAHTEALAEVAAAAARTLGIHSVVTIHGINTSHRYLGTAAQKDYFRRALNDCDRVILVGEPLHDFFAAITGRDDHFRVVHNGFHLPVASRPRKLFGNPVRQLVSVSNLHEGKGIDLTLRALSLLKAAGVDQWHYNIVGDGYMRPQCEDLAKALGLHDQVTFVGAVAHARVADFLIGADIFVLPSWREAFGIAYLEAMACGLLTIGVEGQGAAAFIRQGETGLLCKPKDVEDLARRLAEAMHQPQAMQTIAEAGRRLATEEFSWSNHARQLIGVFRELVPHAGGFT